MPEAVSLESDTAPKRRRAEREGERRPRFISIAAAASYLGISRSHFYTHFYRRVKIVRVGTRALVEFDSIDELGDELANAG
jgi:hypothetical protein